MADLTVIAHARCDECGKDIPIHKCFPDWGRALETGDTCPGCKKGKITVTPVVPRHETDEEPTYNVGEYWWPTMRGKIK